MAETIASLFGPTPEQIEYDRQQAERRRRDDLYATNLAAFKGDLPGFATGYALGTGVGEGLGQAAQGIFGMEPMKDPSLAKSKKSREILREFSTSNLDDPAVLSKMARVFADNDMPEQAMAIQEQARQLKSNQPEQFYTASGAALMEDPSGRYSGLDPKATYQVSTKTKKATELIKGKDAPKDKRTGGVSGATQAVMKNIADVRSLIKDEAETSTFAVTGKAGEFVRSLPRWMQADTKANQFSKSLDTIKANIGFKTLQDMRESSPTGGALGQVAVKELDMLQATLGSLDTTLGPKKILESLKTIEEQYFKILSHQSRETLIEYGFDPNLSADPVEKSIDVSGKVNSKGGTSATSRYNELNAPPPDNYVERR